MLLPIFGAGASEARAQGASNATPVREAVCEAAEERRRRCRGDLRGVTRPNMRFVEIKTCEQQGIPVLHRVRLMLTRQRVQLSNAIRGHMAEYGLVAPVGRNGLRG